MTRLSWSSVNDYMSCPACWVAKRRQGAPRRISPSLVIGSACHGALAALRTARDTDAATSAAILEASRCMAGEDRMGDMGETDPLLDLGSKFGSWTAVEEQYLSLLPHLAAVVDSEAGYEVAGTEVRLEFGDAFDCEFLGFADVILRDRDGLLICKDFKTSASKGLDDSTFRQLAAYTLGVQFSVGNCEEVAADLLVTTKAPQVSTWLDDGMRGKVSPALVRSVTEQINYVAAAIERGDFPVGNPKYGHDVAHPSVYWSVGSLAEAVA